MPNTSNKGLQHLGIPYPSTQIGSMPVRAPEFSTQGQIQIPREFSELSDEEFDRAVGQIFMFGGYFNLVFCDLYNKRRSEDLTAQQKREYVYGRMLMIPEILKRVGYNGFKDLGDFDIDYNAKSRKLEVRFRRKGDLGHKVDEALEFALRD